MDEMFWGTEAEVKRMYAAALTIVHCKLSDIHFVPMRRGGYKIERVW